jgi:hypothetical protein
MFHELLAATADNNVLPGVLGCRTLQRTVQVRLGSNPAVPRDCPVAHPSPRSRDGNSQNIQAINFFVIFNSKLFESSNILEVRDG